MYKVGITFAWQVNDSQIKGEEKHTLGSFWSIAKPSDLGMKNGKTKNIATF